MSLGRVGPVEVEYLAHIEGRGYALRIRPVGRAHPDLEVWVSEKGRSIRCWLDGKELEPRKGETP